MREILHVMRKDARHAWPYMAGLAALTLVFAIVEIKLADMHSPDPVQHRLRALSQLLKLILPVGWMLVIATLLHADSPDGDHHFWLTRPHSRWRLLAAKCAMALLAIMPITLMAQCAILLGRGLSLSDALGELTANTGWLILSGLLPALALASVSRNIPSLVLIGGALFMVARIAPLVAAGTHSDYVYSAGGWGSFATGSTIVVAMSAVVLIRQYLTRRTLQSRIALGVGITAVSALSMVDHWKLAFAAQQRMSTEAAPTVSLELAPEGGRLVLPRFGSHMRAGGNRMVVIPVRYKGTDAMLKSERIRLRIEYPGGWWDSPERNNTHIRQEPGKNHYWFQFEVPSDVHERVSATPSRILLGADLTLYRDRSTFTTPAVLTRRALAGAGTCSAGPVPIGSVLGIACEYAFEPQHSVFVDLVNAAGQRSGRGIIADAPYGPFSRQPALSPVQPRTHSFRAANSMEVYGMPSVIERVEDLATAKLEWTLAEKTAFFHADFTLDGIRLADWQPTAAR